jgi:glycosyltransferase involved in cell wall biosynthesis
MKISGFTIVRNALKFDYPAVESITSLLPLVDEMVVAVGNSEDDTLQLIRNIGSPKIKIVETVWDDALREGGRVLAVETDKALAAVSKDADWCFYIQADEVLHEADVPAVRQAMKKYLNRPEVEGLLFSYVHFYGSYQFVGDSRAWYRKEIRVVRPLAGLHSYQDAQGFRLNNRKLNVVSVPARIHHYGWVKNPLFQQEKQKHFHRLWQDDAWVEKHVAQADAYDYEKIESLKPFSGTHPKVMAERIARLDWTFQFDTSKRKYGLKKWLLHTIESWTGIRLFEYKNYKEIKA